MDSEEEKLISLVTDIIFLIGSTNWNCKAEVEVVSLIPKLFSVHSYEDRSSLRDQIRSCKPKMEFISIMYQAEDMESDSEWEVILSLITQMMFLVSSMDLDSQQPEPESKLIALIKQIVSLFNSKPDSESELISLITQAISLDFSAEQTQESELVSLIIQLVSLKPEPELISLVKHIISRFRSMNWKPKQLISLRPQVMVTFEQGKFRATGEEVQHMESENGECRLWSVKFWRSTGKDHFYCQDCHGQYHEECDQAPLEVKHSLHPKHSLQLVLLTREYDRRIRECYCCDEDLEGIFYYCTACDLAMNIGCVVKQPVLSIDHFKWHLHSLAVYTRQSPLTCNLCGLADLSSPSYMCPPCGFVVHLRCLNLPRAIRISRHPHLISFTSCFDQGDLSCAVCRRKIDNDYGCYSCNKKGCSYAAHSKCATQLNVWDGIELEGVPEEFEEELELFVRISDGVIQHFSHKHHLRLVEKMGRDYEENKQCQACITPIYSGNFYSCMECDFIIHEACANLSRKIHTLVHPHLLTLMGAYDGVLDYNKDRCSACNLVCTGGFFYECREKRCPGFKLHVQCATISEPLIHGSHIHPLFQTSKPGKQRPCGVCKESKNFSTGEIFSCIECEFTLCFACAIIPQEVRYTDDKHLLTLWYGKETRTKTFWCEECEQEINPKERFYKCDEYCCVTIHMECLIGKDLHMKPGLLLRDNNKGIDIKVMSNNHHIARPFCAGCKKRCPQKIMFESSGLVFCSLFCVEEDSELNSMGDDLSTSSFTM